jgi:3-deoxy-7-phosphoheptulonate synthase
MIPSVESMPIVARHTETEPNVVRIGPHEVGGRKLTIMAGPCSVESEEQVMETARRVKAAGATFLRGGAFKPRTSPYSFQGLREEGLRLLAQAARANDLGVITEVMDIRHLDKVAEVADILQVGSRNMQNFTLLDELGRCDKPIMLKRGMAASLEEMMWSAERIAMGGNERILLCER